MFLYYYKNPEATQAALRNFLFHTGDLGYYDEEGLLHYNGRTAERIRHRGENIAAPELEERLVSSIVYPKRMGEPEEFGLLVRQIAENPYLNGENIRLDAALRFPPK